MQPPDPVKSNETHDKPAAAQSENGSKPVATDIFHNPSNLTAEQVGDGYRLLTKAEFENIADPESVTEFWHRIDDEWSVRSSSWSPLSNDNTYRVPIASDLGVGSRVRIIGAPWRFPGIVHLAGGVGKLESIDAGHSARYLVGLVSPEGDAGSVYFEEGAVDRDYAPAEHAEPAEPAQRTFRFNVGDRVVVTGPTMCYDRAEVGKSGVVRIVDQNDGEYPYHVEVGGDWLNSRWFPESSLEAATPAPAPESIEDELPDGASFGPVQVKPSVYVAAHFPDAAQANRVAIILGRAGYPVVSTWHSGEPDAPPEAAALRDFGQIDDADALVLLSTPHRTTGGKFVEAGYALGKGKRVLVLGTRENWMLHHPKVSVFATVEELITSGAV